MSALVEVDGLSVALPTPAGERVVVRDVSMSLDRGEALGLVGESGSGKSMTARAVLRLLPDGARTSGSVRVGGESVLDMPSRRLREFRASTASMVFQDPRAHINPVHTIGHYLTEGLRLVEGLDRHAAEGRAAQLLEEVQIDDPARCMGLYPHQLSGGMLQRVMIAGALASRPAVLLADEPTTALDVTVQAEVMAILARLRRESGLAMLFITHDLDLAAAVCDSTAVMYAGSIVEVQRSAMLHEAPLHPYTQALLASRPRLESRSRRIPVIPGTAASAFEAEHGCAFAPRCDRAMDRCRAERPALRAFGDAKAACWLVEDGHG